MKTRVCERVSVLRCFTIVLINAALIVNDAKGSGIFFDEPPCHDFYAVKEGETLYGIADIVLGVIPRVNCD